MLTLVTSRANYLRGAYGQPKLSSGEGRLELAEILRPCLAVAQAVSRRRPGFEPSSVHVGLDSGAGFLRVLRFPLPLLIPRLLHTRHPSSGAGAMGQ
jgi:hypothetical protein